MPIAGQNQFITFECKSTSGRMMVSSLIGLGWQRLARIPSPAGSLGIPRFAFGFPDDDQPQF